MARDVFDDVIAERDALREQVATLTSKAANREALIERQAEEIVKLCNVKEQVATLTEALEFVERNLTQGFKQRAFDKARAALAAVHGER